MISRSLLFTLLWLLAGATGRPACACSCFGVPSVYESLLHADAVFSGKVIWTGFADVLYDTVTRQTRAAGFGSRIDSFVSSAPRGTHEVAMGGRAFRVVADKKYKGKNLTDTVLIVTNLGDWDCGINLELGKRYFIYGSGPDLKSRTGAKKARALSIYWCYLCTRTALWRAGEEWEVNQTIKDNGDEVPGVRKN